MTAESCEKNKQTEIIDSKEEMAQWTTKEMVPVSFWNLQNKMD